MNANFKPLGLAAAVAAATAGYAGVVNAQEVAAETELGDLAIVPYYTVQEGYATGVNVINTTGETHVVKIRFRRATDSMDALDFNVVLSPYDMYTGFITTDGDDIKFVSNDNSCTAPAYPEGGFVMPSIYRENAETGYIEIISMGSPISETQPIAISAKHGANGVPADCKAVRDNFFADATATTRGVFSSSQTHQLDANGVAVPSLYRAADDDLKVSYLIKSDETGVEFGDNAVHISGFLDVPSMTNQQKGVFEGDLLGFDHPDLNGASPLADGRVSRFGALRQILGADALINDWSQNSNDTIGFTVDTDWVVTFPGQYVMLNLPQYLGFLALPEDISCTGTSTAISCDNRDIPMRAEFAVYDREEQGIVVEEGDLVVSPQPPGEVVIDVLDKEVNVIEWGQNPVLNAPSSISVSKPEGAAFGWAALVATSSANKTQAICDYVVPAQPAGNPVLPKLPAMTCAAASGSAPVVGFAAWQRAFDANPGSNYGRIVEHSREQASAD